MNDKFSATVEKDTFDDTLFLKITHNGYQYQVVRLDDPVNEIPIIVLALQECLVRYNKE